MAECLSSQPEIWMAKRGNDMPKNKQIADRSIYDASDFWDEHDFDEFDDILETDRLQFQLQKKKYVGIEMEIYFIIKNKAKMLNIAEDVLINEWLSEKATISSEV